MGKMKASMEGETVMHRGEGLGRLIIDLDAVLGEAAVSMSSRDDLCWSVGYALQELYPEKIAELHKRMDMMWRLASTDEN